MPLSFFKNLFRNIDWVLFLSVCMVTFAGLITMNSFTATSRFFERQSIWFGISLAVLFIFSSVFKGSQSWFDLGTFSFQPTDPVKLVVILILAKYFSRRHIEIARVRHILVSGFYVFVIFLLVFLQPDFGSAIIIFFLWLGIVLVSGISKKHLLVAFLSRVMALGGDSLGAYQPRYKSRTK